ncbi:hypothetical protein AALA99_01670 [Anaerotruncus colihominis]|uniref:hypothetical protein n=1 Tax=Anaerotruncus colihominis TaxID=169435 RepID=UPI0035127A76
MDTAKLEERINQLQSELRKLQVEVLKARRREEDQEQNKKWQESGLLPEGWCIHKIVIGRREFFIICDVPDFYEQHDQIRIRFYTPDIFGIGDAEKYITNTLQSILHLRKAKI